MRTVIPLLLLLSATPGMASDFTAAEAPLTDAVARPAPGQSKVGALAPTNQFQGFVRFSAERRFFETMAMDTAYYRDVFTGGNTLNSDPNDGDSFSARLFGPNGSLVGSWSPVVFHRFFNGQENCWVGFSSGTICGVTSVFVTWFIQSQCFAPGDYQMEFLYNSQAYSQGTFHLLQEIPPQALPSDLSVYNQGRYDGSSPVQDHYDNRCYVSSSSVRHDCDGRAGEQMIWIKKLGCYLSDAALVTTYHGLTLSPPGLNDLLNAVQGGYVQGDVDPTKVASEATRLGVPISFLGRKPDSALLQNVCQFGPQLLGVKCNSNNRPGHWVVATGFDPGANSIKIVDPSGGQATTMAKYGNQFCGTRVFSGPEFSVTINSRLVITFHSPVQLLLSDPVGRRLGRDATTGAYFEEIPDAYYDDVGLIDDETDEPAEDPPKQLFLPRPASGEYSLTVVGTAEGSYTAEFLSADAQGNEFQTVVADIPTSAGAVHALSFNYDSTAAEGIELRGGYDGGGQRPRDVNAFLSYGNPSQSTTDLTPGTQTFSLAIFYGETTDPVSFSAQLDRTDVTSLFQPAPGTGEVVQIPLTSGRNVLKVSINGTVPGGRVATDSDRLVFLVP